MRQSARIDRQKVAISNSFQSDSNGFTSKASGTEAASERRLRNGVYLTSMEMQGCTVWSI